MPKFQKLESFLLKIFHDHDVLLSENNFSDQQFIGLRLKESELVAGTYDAKSNEWKHCPIPENCEVIPQQGPGSKHMHIVFSGSFPADVYLAIEQKASENTVAITPLVCPDDASLNRLQTYFFRS